MFITILLSNQAHHSWAWSSLIPVKAHSFSQIKGFGKKLLFLWFFSFNFSNCLCFSWGRLCSVFCWERLALQCNVVLCVTSHSLQKKQSCIKARAESVKISYWILLQCAHDRGTYCVCVCFHVHNTWGPISPCIVRWRRVSSCFVNSARGRLGLCTPGVNTVMAKWTRCWVCPDWRQRALRRCTDRDTGSSLALKVGLKVMNGHFVMGHVLGRKRLSERPELEPPVLWTIWFRNQSGGRCFVLDQSTVSLALFVTKWRN